MNTKEIKQSIKRSEAHTQGKLFSISMVIISLLILFLFVDVCYQIITDVEEIPQRRVEAEVQVHGNLIYKDQNKDFWYFPVTVTQGNYSENIIAKIDY